MDHAAAAKERQHQQQLLALMSDASSNPLSSPFHKLPLA